MIRRVIAYLFFLFGMAQLAGIVVFVEHSISSHSVPLADIMDDEFMNSERVMDDGSILSISPDAHLHFAKAPDELIRNQELILFLAVGAMFSFMLMILIVPLEKVVKYDDGAVSARAQQDGEARSADTGL